MMSKLKAICSSRPVRILVVLLVLVILFLLISNSSVALNPKAENQAMARLDQLQSQTQPTSFTTDGCSGGLSANWPTIMDRLSTLAPQFADNYALEAVPFENACIEHDKAYHEGIGGYVGRLNADNTFRLAIINYGIDNASIIQERLNLKSEVDAIFLYEALAEAIYLSVRAGGAPCTGQPYQWGYGYTTDQC